MWWIKSIWYFHERSESIIIFQFLATSFISIIVRQVFEVGLKILIWSYFLHICIIWLIHLYTFKKLQSWTKMSRIIAGAMCSFKIKLFKILAKEKNTQSWTLAGSFLPLTEQHWSSDMVQGGRVHGSNKSAEWVSCGWVKLFLLGCKVVNFWSTVKPHD